MVVFYYLADQANYGVGSQCQCNLFSLVFCFNTQLCIFFFWFPLVQAVSFLQKKIKNKKNETKKKVVNGGCGLAFSN